MEELKSLQNPNPRSPSPCDECGANAWKYRCPGCSIKSCSLPCVKSHKERTNCNGKRKRTDFVPLSQFDDNRLLSDYNLLEETKRVADSARRILSGFRGYFGFKLPQRLWMLRNAANRRKTRLLLLPPGMSMREANRSRYDQRKNSIFWTIEWRFHSTDVVLVDHSVNEHVSLSSVLEKHLAPSPWNNQLSPYRNVQMDDLKFFLRKNPKGFKSPYRELDIEAPIGQQLADTVILEYPVILVFLPSHSYDFEVEKAIKLSPKHGELLGSCNPMPSPKGTLYAEEEVEEGEVVGDTQVTDLTALRNSANRDNVRVPQDVTVIEKAAWVSDKQIPGTVAEGLKPKSSNNCQSYMGSEAERYSDGSLTLTMSSEDANFEFEQKLKEAYSDIIGDINPEDFLCLDGVFEELDIFGEKGGDLFGEFLKEDGEKGGNLFGEFLEKNGEKGGDLRGESLEEDELEEGEFRSH